jgi:Na+-driven multidrug efflux pump
MSIWLIGMPVFAMESVGMTLMRAYGDAVTPGYLSAAGALLQIVIAPFFIFGIGFFPELGLAGAAVGFVIARSITFLLFTYVFVFRDKMLLLDLAGFSQSVREILHVGLPAMAANLIMPVSMGVTTRLLAGHGTAVVAGFGVAMRIEFMAIMMIFAVSMSISPIVGQNWGAKLYDRVKTVMRSADIFVMAWGVFSYLLLIVFGSFFVGLINNDPHVVEAAYNYLLIGPLAVGAMGVTFNATHCFNALGKPMPPLIISLLRMVVVNIPLILLGNYLWGYMGIFAGTVVTTIVLAVVARRWVNHTIDRRVDRTVSAGLGRAEAGVS